MKEAAKRLYVLRKMEFQKKLYLQNRYEDRRAAPPSADRPIEITDDLEHAHIFKTEDAALVFAAIAKLSEFQPIGVNIIV